MAVGRDRFYFPPPSTSTDYDSMVDKITAIGDAIATAEETEALRESVQNLQLGQEDLNHRTDLLSPMQDYGSAYMRTAQSFSQAGPLKFDQQVGPMQNCFITNDGRIRLQDKGLWDIRCQIWVDYINVLSGRIDWEVQVLDPTGDVFSRQCARVNDGNPVSTSIITSVVVPAAGYDVRASVTWIAAFRGLLGGPDRSRLTVQHISRSTDHPI